MSTVLIVCDDLLLTSKVTATARAQGITALVARTVASALTRAGATPPGCVLIDLHSGGLDLIQLIAGLKSCCPNLPRLIGFGSHVNVEALKSARGAGCHLVLPRSQFSTQLESSLNEWCQPVTLPESPEVV